MFVRGTHTIVGAFLLLSLCLCKIKNNSISPNFNCIFSKKLFFLILIWSIQIIVLPLYHQNKTNKYIKLWRKK